MKTLKLFKATGDSSSDFMRGGRYLAVTDIAKATEIGKKLVTGNLTGVIFLGDVVVAEEGE